MIWSFLYLVGAVLGAWLFCHGILSPHTHKSSWVFDLMAFLGGLLFLLAMENLK